MNISDVAKTGLTSKAIRFMKRRAGNAAVAERNGYRTYSQQHLDELTLLRRAAGGV